MSLSRILEPTSVAIVGASADEDKRGYQAIKDLQESEYDGRIFAINPRHEGEIRGLETYDAITDIPEPVDLAFVATPAHTVPDIIRDCGDAGIAGAVIIAAGFGEEGNDTLEDDLVRVARENCVRLIGPNIQGIANVSEDLNLLGGYKMPHGNIGLLTQSGNMGLALGKEAVRYGDKGFSFNIGIGNESDLRFDEYLPFLDGHEETDVIMIYAEGMNDGRAFLQQASEITLSTPIVVMRGGVSDAGKRSAESHTDSLAGQRKVIEAAYSQAGVMKVDRSDELIPIADALAKLPPASGTGIGIVSDGGGHATVAADSLAETGMIVPSLEAETQETLYDRVPEASEVANPVDIMGQGGDLSAFADCCRIVLEDSNIDALLLTGNFGGYGEYGYTANPERVDEEISAANDIADLVSEYRKPVVIQSIYAGLESEALQTLEEADVPVHTSLDIAANCLAKLSEYGVHLGSADEKTDFDVAVESINPDPTESGQLSEYRSKQLLADHDIPVVPYRLATTSAEAVSTANDFNTPVVMKISSPDIVHKTEADAVRLDVEGKSEVERTYDELYENAVNYAPNAEIEGVLVSPMVEGEVELIVGVTQDEEVGPVLMFGVGGIFTELLEDVAFRALPITEHDARRMLEDIQSTELLEGARGRPAIDQEMIVDLLMSVSEFVADVPEVSSVDLNPVFATEDSVAVVDSSIQLEEADTE